MARIAGWREGIDTGTVAPFLRADGNIEEDDRPLEDVHPDQLLHQVVLGHHAVEADHDEDHVNPVVVLAHDEFNHLPVRASPCSAPVTRSKKMETMTAMTVICTPSSIMAMP